MSSAECVASPYLSLLLLSFFFFFCLSFLLLLLARLSRVIIRKRLVGGTRTPIGFVSLFARSVGVDSPPVQVCAAPMVPSLQELSKRVFSGTGPPPVSCVVTDALLSALMPCKEERGYSAASTLKDALEESIRAGGESPHGTTDAYETVLQHLRSPADGGYRFPGPMCSPLRRRHASMLRGQPYTLTEKSDGVRIAAFFVRVNEFPCWSIDAVAGGAAPGLISIDLEHLCNVATLENAAATILSGGGTESISVAVHSSQGSEVVLRCSREPLPEGDAFRLVPVPRSPPDNNDVSVAGEGGSLVVKRRCGPRFLMFAVDRTVSAAHLFLNTPATPFCDDYESLVVDGELMLAHRSVAAGQDGALSSLCPGTTQDHGCSRLVIGLFDFFGFKKSGEEEQLLTDMPMSGRYERLKAAFTRGGTGDSALPPWVAAEGCVGGGVSLFVKSMWPISRFGECLARISYDAASRRYWYDGPFGFTRNDGFVFTPEVFPIVSCASDTQVKWKWRSQLSVDWLVTVSDPHREEFHVEVFFRKKNYGSREDTAGHWRCHKPMRLLNPHHVDVFTDHPVLVECVFDSCKGCWSIERVRNDRSGANSIVTILSVFESLAENITLAALCGILGLVHAGTAADPTLRGLCTSLEPDVATSAPTMEDPGPARGPHAETTATGGRVSKGIASHDRYLTAKLGLRAVSTPQGETKLMLYWTTNTGNAEVTRGIPCQLCLVRECSGLGLPCALSLRGKRTAGAPPSPTDAEGMMAAHESVAAASGWDPDSGAMVACDSKELEDYLFIELANAGGSCAWSEFAVDAYFDGDAGHWVIVKLYPEAKNTRVYFDFALNHLQWLIEKGGGDAAGKALPASFRGPPARIPRARVAETQLTNDHYAQKAVALGSTSGVLLSEKGASTPPTRRRGALRQFHNWVKSVLLWEQGVRVKERMSSSEEAAKPVESGDAGKQPRAQLPHKAQRGRRDYGSSRCKGQAAPCQGKPPSHRAAGPTLRALDVCCGRGGDLLKWRALRPSFLYMTDSSFECVAEAAARYCTLKGLSTKAVDPGVPAHFAVHDAFGSDTDLASGLRRFTADGATPFHIVSCQFSLHYGCFSEERLDRFLATVSSCLATAGVFVATTVNDAELLRRFQRLGPEFGNTHYHIRFPPESVDRLAPWATLSDLPDTSALPFGVRYCATVEDVVTGLPEFIVPWRHLQTVAARHSLHVILDESLSAFADRNAHTSFGQELLSSLALGVKRGRGHAERQQDSRAAFSLTPEEEEASALYRVFALAKGG